MSPILIPSNTLRDAKRLFGRLKHLRCKFPVLQHLMLTAGQNGIQLAATDLDQWLETQVSDQPAEYACFLIPPAAMDAACRADKGTDVTLNEALTGLPKEERETLAPVWQQVAKRHQIKLRK